MDMDRVWGVTVRAGQGGWEERGKGENWNNCNRITIKKCLKDKKSTNRKSDNVIKE